MTETERRLVAALEHNEQIAARVIETLTALTLCRLETPVAVVAVSTGARLQLAPDHVIGVAEWRLFDTLIAQLHEAKAASAELVAQLSWDPPA